MTRAPRRSQRTIDLAIATCALIAIVAHDYAHVSDGRWFDAFWVCNVSAILIAPAIVMRSALLATASLTWLWPGTVVWLVDALVAGSNILPTSYAVHLGGTAAAFYAVRISGAARRGWLFSVGIVVACVVTSMIWLPPEANVNAAHAVPKGWGFLGGSRVGFIAAGSALVVALALFGQLLTRWVAPSGKRSAVA